MKIQLLKNPKYIVVVELSEVSGFIVSYELSFKKAKLMMDQLLDKYCNSKDEEIRKTLPHLFRYELYPNSLYLSKSKCCSTNGHLSFSVVEVDSQTFNPYWFIKERQNSPYLLSVFKEESSFAELFEEIPFFMN